MTVHTRRTTVRTGVRAAAAVALGLSLVTACAEDSAGPEAGGVTTSDIQNLEREIGELESRVGALEGGDAGVGAEEESEFFGNEEDFIGEEVTISADVSELITTTGVGSAFRIGGETGTPIAVISADQPTGLDVDDVVRVTGTVFQISRDTFEQDFGVAADELFEDADGFFEEQEGRPAIAARNVQVLQAQSEDSSS